MRKSFNKSYGEITKRSKNFDQNEDEQKKNMKTQHTYKWNKVLNETQIGRFKNPAALVVSLAPLVFCQLSLVPLLVPLRQRLPLLNSTIAKSGDKRPYMFDIKLKQLYSNSTPNITVFFSFWLRFKDVWSGFRSRSPNSALFSFFLRGMRRIWTDRIQRRKGKDWKGLGFNETLEFCQTILNCMIAKFLQLGLHVPPLSPSHSQIVFERTDLGSQVRLNTILKWDLKGKPNC